MTEILYHSFQCPRCGSREWGTNCLTGPFTDWVGYCSGCDFTWMRTDDPQYWKPVDVDWDEEGEEC